MKIIQSSIKNAEVFLSLFFILFGGVIFWQASSMDYYSEFGPGPGLLPLWISGFIILLAVINLIKSIKINKDSTSFAKILPRGTGLINLLACVGSLAIYITIVKYVGFTISSTITLFILFSRGYKWLRALVLSILVTGILFFIFVLTLEIPLPLNSFGW